MLPDVCPYDVPRLQQIVREISFLYFFSCGFWRGIVGARECAAEARARKNRGGTHGVPNAVSANLHNLE